jgi:DNA-binding Lrp family transcriptional regulator
MASRFSYVQPIKIDMHNRKLLQHLAADCRLTATELGKRLRLSREVVGYRIKRLQEAQVIQQFTIAPNYKKLGYRLYRILFLLDERDQKQHPTFISFISSHPNTVSVVEYSETWDIAWEFICKDIDEFDAIARTTESKFSAIILQMEKYVTITTYTAGMFPVSAQPKRKTAMGTGNIDATDLHLLSTLATDAKASSYTIGAALKLSSDTIIHRMRSLQDRDLLEGYTTVINLAALGYAWHVYAIEFSPYTEKDEAKLAEYVAKHPNILRAVKVLGTWEILLDVVIETPEQYHTLAKEIKNLFANIIRRYESWTVHSECCYTPFPAILTSSISQTGTAR